MVKRAVLRLALLLSFAAAGADEPGTNHDAGARAAPPTAEAIAAHIKSWLVTKKIDEKTAPEGQHVYFVRQTGKWITKERYGEMRTELERFSGDRDLGPLHRRTFAAQMFAARQRLETDPKLLREINHHEWGAVSAFMVIFELSLDEVRQAIESAKKDRAYWSQVGYREKVMPALIMKVFNVSVAEVTAKRNEIKGGSREPFTAAAFLAAYKQSAATTEAPGNLTQVLKGFGDGSVQELRSLSTLSSLFGLSATSVRDIANANFSLTGYGGADTKDKFINWRDQFRTAALEAAYTFD